MPHFPRSQSLTLTAVAGLPLIEPGDDLPRLLLGSMDRQGLELRDGDVLILAQKIVSKAEDRFVHLPDLAVSSAAAALAAETGKNPHLVQAILDESRAVLRSRPGLIVVEHRLGFVCANAGIDHSNVRGSDDWVLLLPEDPDRSAAEIRRAFETTAGVRIGVLIIDSHGRAWRHGTVGVVIGLSGLPGLVDQRGEVDLFERELVATVIGAADELAAGASLVMGQTGEGTPAVHARGYPYPLGEGTLADLLRPEERDLFR
ncbi:MAG TPA: coenzyme F420-0:L-glutamate ligase [Anaerolineales bacterium]|nr:coenzyme F420-0:L-glutamate ligase [Anaerolineales bacterium]